MGDWFGYWLMAIGITMFLAREEIASNPLPFLLLFTLSAPALMFACWVMDRTLDK